MSNPSTDYVGNLIHDAQVALNEAHAFRDAAKKDRDLAATQLASANELLRSVMVLATDALKAATPTGAAK